MKKNKILKYSNPLFGKFLEVKPRKGDLKKAEILEATIRCLVEEGIENTNYESIGQKCGILKAHVAYYYPDKDQLIQSAVEFCAANAQEVTQKNLDKAKASKKKVSHFIEGAFNWMEKYPEQARVLLLFHYLSSIHKNYRQLYQKVGQSENEMLQGAVKQSYPKIKQPEKFAKFIRNTLTANLVEGLASQSLSIKGLRKLTHEQVEKSSKLFA